MTKHGAPALTTAQTDRAAGVLLAQGCGDALTAHRCPGEYGDATQMAVCIAQVAATGADLTTEAALDEIAQRFLTWLTWGSGAPDEPVLAGATDERPAGAMRAAARTLHGGGCLAGNGALIRTAPVALAHLDEPDAMAEAARAVAELTHADPLAGDACVLWCAGIATAVLTGTLDGLRHGLDLLPGPRRDRWAGWLGEAEHSAVDRPDAHGSTVPALQAAYAAVRRTPVPPDEPARGSFACLHLQHALAAAARLATNPQIPVAALAGSLLGARWGESAVPFGWRRAVHGWPELRSRDLVRLGVLAARAGEPDDKGWPQCARMPYETVAPPAVAHPFDDGVLLGAIGAVDETLAGDVPAGNVFAVVSLCRRGRAEVPAPGVDAADHVEVRLRDRADPAENSNLEFVIDDAARAVATLRDEGKRVFLHCVYGRSRTPTVAARYAVLRGVPTSEALDAVLAALPDASANPGLRAALERLGPPGAHGPGAA